MQIIIWTLKFSSWRLKEMLKEKKKKKRITQTFCSCPQCCSGAPVWKWHNHITNILWVLCVSVDETTKRTQMNEFPFCSPSRRWQRTHLGSLVWRDNLTHQRQSCSPAATTAPATGDLSQTEKPQQAESERERQHFSWPKRPRTREDWRSSAINWFSLISHSILFFSLSERFVCLLKRVFCMLTCPPPPTPHPPQFLSLASSILNFVTTSMLKSRNNFIRNYLSVSLTEQHMATLASIIKDVDKDVKGALDKQMAIMQSVIFFCSLLVHQGLIFNAFCRRQAPQMRCFL